MINSVLSVFRHSRTRRDSISLHMILFTLACLMAVGSASAQPTLYVAPPPIGNDATGDGTPLQPFATIQKGIQTAVDGDTVTLFDGVFTGPGNVNNDFLGKEITVNSFSGSVSTVVDCEGAPGVRGFIFQSGETTSSILQGITIQNGRAPVPLAETNARGGGIYCKDASPLIANCVITGNEATGIARDFSSGGFGAGGGIYIENSSAIIVSCLITGNTVLGGSASILNSGGAGLGGGICSINSSPVITDCLILSNFSIGGPIGGGTAGIGIGGGFYASGSSPRVERCEISSNKVGGNGSVDTAAGSGGGVYMIGPASFPEFTDCTISLNIAHSGGAAGMFCATTTGSGMFQRCTFSENSTIATGNGGGVFSGNGTLSLINCTISGNEVDQGTSGGIHASGGTSTLNLLNCTVANNSAFSNGGGIRQFQASVNLKNTLLAGNSPSNLSGLFNSFGHNLSSDSSVVLSGTDDRNGINPNLGLLQNNGGLTRTHALGSPSQAIDGGDNTDAPETDQRGTPRPLDGDSNGSLIADIGAYEYALAPSATPTPTPTTTPTDTPTPSPTPTATVQPGCGRTFGDFDNSCCVDIFDFLFLLDNWNTVVDGSLIDLDDFLALLDNWNTGSACPPTPTPTATP